MKKTFHGAVAELGALVWLPSSMFAIGEIKTLQRRLTVTVKGYRPEDPPTVIENYVNDVDRRMIGVPVYFGLKLLQERGMTVLMDVATGSQIDVPKRPDPNHPNAAPGQAELMRATLEAARENITVLVKASTGSGKTSVALNTIAELGRTALVIVATKELARQWEREAILHLGLTSDQIGHVEAGKCDYRGKVLVIAVIINLVARKWESEFYRHYGITVADESHKLGATTFSLVMRQFAARHRIALTATPTRRDGAECLFLDYYGPPIVVGEVPALPCDVRVVNYQNYMKGWQNGGINVMISRLTMDGLRNKQIAMLIQTLYRKGRNVLVLSDRVQQLQTLMGMCAGIPADEMGLYVRQKNKPKVKGEKVKKEKAATPEELDHVRKHCRIILSTYGMGREGLDIPRLDAGIDASPRAEGIQPLGRIRRPFPNKPKPVWFTFRDLGIPPLEGITRARLRSYATCPNVSIID